MFFLDDSHIQKHELHFTTNMFHTCLLYKKGYWGKISIKCSIFDLKIVNNLNTTLQIKDALHINFDYKNA